jgi:hypothetical protein
MATPINLNISNSSINIQGNVINGDKIEGDIINGNKIVNPTSTNNISLDIEGDISRSSIIVGNDNTIQTEEGCKTEKLPNKACT